MIIILINYFLAFDCEIQPNQNGFNQLMISSKLNWLTAMAQWVPGKRKEKIVENKNQK